jgi:hypothetical protein
MEEKNVLSDVSEPKPTISEHINRDTSNNETEQVEEKDINVLSGDNKVDVDIEPDVKSNDVYLQLCSCSIVFNCLTKDSPAKNSD